jgi:hypothetical protein
VTTPDDRETKPGSTGSPEKQVWLPPRLRDKLDTSGGGGSDDDFDFLKKKSSPIGMIIGIVIAVVAVGGIAMLVVNSREKAKVEAAKEAAAAAAAHQAAIQDSLAQIRQADSVRAVAHADSVAFAKLPKWKQKQVLAQRAAKAGGAAAGGAAATAATPAPSKPAGGGAATGTATTSAGASAGGAGTAPAPSEPAAPHESGPYAIDAAQYLDEAKANSVADELKAKTSLPAHVASISDTYHVLLGSFTKHSAAEAKANALFNAGKIEQAGVVAIPKK